MKKKKAAAFLCSLVLGAVIASSCACTVFPDATFRNPYEVATDLGYDGSEADWIAGQQSQSSQAYRMYEEAKKAGFQGSYLDFLAQYNLGAFVDDRAAVQGALMSCVAIDSRFSTKKGTTVSNLGSGVIYSLDKEAGHAYVITNYHVIYNENSISSSKIGEPIYVTLYGGGTMDEALQAEYVGGVANYDIAVLEIKGDKQVSIVDRYGSLHTHTNRDVLSSSYARTIAAGNSDAVAVGTRVYAIGNAEGEGISATQGIISVESEYIEIKKPDDSTQTISLPEFRIDAAVNHGNSGGGLFDVEGKFIGTVNARSEAEGVEAFGYAIPSNIVLSVAQNIIDNRASMGAQRATLGITVQVAGSKSIFNEEEQRAYIMETVAIRSVNPSSAAFGKLQADDVIFSLKVLDGERVVMEKVITRMAQLDAVMFNIRKGNKLEIVVSRSGKLLTHVFTFDDNDDFTRYS